jgi:hypothetical protein
MRLVALFALCAVAWCQTADFVAAGASWNQGATPAVGGTGLYAHRLADGTYYVSIVDILPTSYKPFLTQTNASSGIAQKVREIFGLSIYAIGSAGVVTTGVNTGWTWTAGGGAPIKLPGKAGDAGWFVMPTVRVINPNVSDRRYIAGLMLSWGK